MGPQRQASPPLRHHLVLAGGGHSHALVLRQWAMRPALRPARTLITLVSRHSTALYSGMVPGLVAGLYRRDACAIDLRRLCAEAGVTFVRAEITGLRPQERELLLAGRPPLRFDRLSLDVGAVTAVGAGASEADGAGGAGESPEAWELPMPVKPLEPFLAWCQSRSSDVPLRIRGGGAAAVELALAFRARGLPARLLLRGEALHLGSRAANRAGERLLAEAGIPVERNVGPDAPADLACTGSEAPAWLAASGLPVDPTSGRVLTEASLAVLGHPALLAAGDCGQIATAPRPPSGVWAVRAAPLLARNLRRSLEQPERPLEPWRPQARALQLLGDGGWRERGSGNQARWGPAARARPPRALALWGPLALGPSRWLWRWKDRIDRQFMARLQSPAPMGASGADAAGAMACRGCAAKLAASPLAGALARLAGEEPGDDAVIPAAEDAALVATTAAGEQLLQSVDGFPALVEDPWLNGRLTTLHACSDLWASGARVASAQALVTVPEAAPGVQEELLLQTLAGVRSVLDPLGARLIGGHSLEGRDGAGLGLGLTVNGLVTADQAWPKGPLQPGDVLLLTRPIGSGVLFAAAMAGAARPGWIDAALEVMQQSQAPLVALLAAHGCQACTDITGFGLLGHLGEMLGSPHPVTMAAGPGATADAGPVPAAPAQVELDATAIPALAGALELLAQGLASTLAPANAAALALLAPEGPIHLAGPADAARRALLVDPQTCGPLLAALPEQRVPATLAALREAGFAEAAVIGRVVTG
ncbi:selenide, water dikinase SelD [Vulcanococcus limneticus]|uniref:selenide, water dikinase SelD n=1 Tax=Vulcanococcus limneticus TaxID=2170428 RepID=UPI00398BD93C